MMDVKGLIERLRQPTPHFACGYPCEQYAYAADVERQEAADTLERLAAEVADETERYTDMAAHAMEMEHARDEMKAALEGLLETADLHVPSNSPFVIRARAALKAKEPEHG